MTKAKQLRLSELEKKHKYIGIILNERPPEMSYEDYKGYLELQKEYIKRNSILVWNSKRQGTFKGNINKYIIEQIKKAQKHD